ncbi:MAG: MBL fold metallo-hydrolase [Treponema sp.]|nr:MBL fold metallo-hydrolase [Treponema sp.]
MKITILTDNISEDENLKNEWGFSVLIEYNGKKILLDAGQSDAFTKNAARLNFDIGSVDIAVLSHAHYDHTNGLPEFFRLNSTAPVYISRDFGENCYHKMWIFYKYIGIKKGLLKKYENRFIRASGIQQVADGIHLLGHNTPGLKSKGAAAKLYIKRNGHFGPDDFTHEQSLIFDTPKGLVIFNSCSHAGADNIVSEVSRAFPDKKIYSILGGFHLFRMPDSEVLAFAERLRALDVQKIYTGHCTGQHAFELLHDTLGDRAEQLKVGRVIEF